MLLTRAARVSMSGGPWVGVVAAVVLLGLLGAGDLAHPTLSASLATPSDAALAYQHKVDTLLARYDRSIALEHQLLDQRDANPGLTGSPDWLQTDARVVRELEAEYHDARALVAPAGALGLQRCVAEGLRLSATGAALLHEAFLTDGHGAYYFASHGNWDLDLGRQHLQTCRRSAVPGTG